MKSSLMFCTAACMAMLSCNSSTRPASQPAQEAEAEAPSKVLVVIDVQRDFFSPEGSLYVGGSEVLPAQIAEAAADYDAVIFTLDWHPGNHCSFAEQGGTWPSHCVAYTQGAGLADEFSKILASGKAYTFLKGQEQDKEQYGAFEDLAEDCPIRHMLENCDSIDVCGIAGDYCVKESTTNILNYADASKVSILTSLVRSIDDGSALEQFIAEKQLGRK